MIIGYKKLLKIDTYYISPVYKVCWLPKLTNSGIFFGLKAKENMGKRNQPGIHFTKSPDSRELADYPGVLVKCSLGGDIIEFEAGYTCTEAYILKYFDENTKQWVDAIPPIEEFNVLKFLEEMSEECLIGQSLEGSFIFENLPNGVKNNLIREGGKIEFICKEDGGFWIKLEFVSDITLFINFSDIECLKAIEQIDNNFFEVNNLPVEVLLDYYFEKNELKYLYHVYNGNEAFIKHALNKLDEEILLPILHKHGYVNYIYDLLMQSKFFSLKNMLWVYYAEFFGIKEKLLREKYVFGNE